MCEDSTKTFKAKVSLEENYAKVNSWFEVLGINLGRDFMVASSKLKQKTE